MATWFSNPWVLWLSCLLPVLSLLSAWSWRRRHAQLAQLGVLSGLIRVRRGPRMVRSLCVFLALLLLIAGSAGPQWGADTRADSRTTPMRDLVVVLDLSKSMLAETPSRQELARRAVNDLAAALKVRGGFRVALVVFAAHPKLVFPLTNDYDHLAQAVARHDAAGIPKPLRADPDQGDVSGTRIGAALRLAVQVHDPAMRGAQDILLISDGDDPLDDGEWRQGLATAQEQHIPVHAAGIGTPDEDSTIPSNGDVLRDDQGNKIVSRLREDVLGEIARRTHGVYISGRTQRLPLGRIYQDIVAARPTSLTPAGDVAGPSILHQQRYPWFLAGALFFLGASISIPERGFRLAGRAPRPLLVGCALLALTCVSAGPPGMIDDLVRRGNAAFSEAAVAGEPSHAEAKYREAQKLYEQAEELAADPGLVAFNKAACLYRLNQYLPATRLYRACLEDQQVPAGRRVRAWYDLANCLVREGSSSAPALEEALDLYRRCLADSQTPDDLRTDATHNLEIAKLLWLKVRASSPKDRPKGDDPKDDPHKDKPKKKKPDGEQPKDKGKTAKSGDVGGKQQDNGEPGGQESGKTAGKDQLYSLPDQDELKSLPPAAAADLLDRAVRRIVEDRRAWNRPGDRMRDGVKDW